jgi:hypothetical protein
MTPHLAGIEQNLLSVNCRGDYFPGYIQDCALRTSQEVNFDAGCKLLLRTNEYSIWMCEGVIGVVGSSEKGVYTGENSSDILAE